MLDRTATAPMRGDADQLFQAVVNLLDNALRHAQAGGHVVVSTVADADGAVLEVADRGPGIAEADRSRVFDRFERLRPDRGTPGSGLGLSLVRAIVIRHGGRIELEDNRPGLRVRLRFPAAAGDQSAAS